MIFRLRYHKVLENWLAVVRWTICQIYGRKQNEGNLLSSNCDHGEYDPKDSTVNFAVPSINAVTSFIPNSNVPKDLKLGIINEAIWI